MRLMLLIGICLFLLAVAGVIVRKFVFSKNGILSIIDRKNIQAINSYMELKFLNKNLADNLFNDNKIPCTRLINEIKEYYHLKDIIIFDSIRMFSIDNDIANHLRYSVYEYVSMHSRKIFTSCKQGHPELYTLKTNGRKYILHIFTLAPTLSRDGFIICVEEHPSLLGNIERLGLENNINLLKMRLLNQ